MTSDAFDEKRDLFAAQALSGLLASLALTRTSYENERQFAVRVAETAYDFADAMMRTKLRRTA